MDHTDYTLHKVWSGVWEVGYTGVSVERLDSNKQWEIWTDDRAWRTDHKLVDVTFPTRKSAHRAVLAALQISAPAYNSPEPVTLIKMTDDQWRTSDSAWIVTRRVKRKGSCLMYDATHFIDPALDIKSVTLQAIATGLAEKMRDLKQ